VNNMFGDIPRGIFVVRGENVVLLGEVDSEEDPKDQVRVPIETILAAQHKEQLAKQEKEKLKLKALKERGLMSIVEQNDDMY